MRLTESKLKLAQLGPVSKVGGRGNEGGIKAAVRDLGIGRSTAQRAVKVAGLLKAGAPKSERACFSNVKAPVGDTTAGMSTLCKTIANSNTHRRDYFPAARLSP